MANTTDRLRAANMLETFREDHGILDRDILEHIIFNYLSGTQAKDALKSVAEELEIDYRIPE